MVVSVGVLLEGLKDTSIGSEVALTLEGESVRGSSEDVLVKLDLVGVDNIGSSVKGETD